MDMTFSSTRHRAFTLIEMLVVITIITILGGMILAALLSARRTAKERAIEGTLQLLKGQLDRYENDFQDYPPSDGDLDGIRGSENLYRCLRTEKKEGPYITSAEIKTCDINKNGEPEIADEFGRPIGYIHHKDYANKPPNKRNYRLISPGVNGKFENGDRGSDDIVNWNKDKPDQ
jgi:prepilin-type N-terminal cleavage/methylation domain-containing protein